MVRPGASTIRTSSSPLQAVKAGALQAVDGRLWLIAVAVRLAIIVVLVAGPWTDQPAELSGWDAERFQAIADRQGAAWVDQPIEYPPGSVVAIDLLAGDNVVATNRALVVISAIFEAIAVAVLWRRFGPRTAKTFLLIGLPLVPMGYLRLDLVVAVIATIAAAALLNERGSAASSLTPPLQEGTTSGSGRTISIAAFGVLAAAGAMIKIWPALLVAGAIALARYRAAALCTAVMALFGFGWLAATGAGLEPIDQVLSLRGATGWHVESLPGSVVALFSDADPRLELNAFRIGTLNRSAVSIARVFAVAVIAALALFGLRSGLANEVTRLALVMLGAVSALLVTAPLLSPQFLLWLTPWIALLVGARSAPAAPVIASVAAVVLTGFTLTVFGPANLANTVPALLLLIRNLALLVVPIACMAALRTPQPTLAEPAADAASS